MENNFQMSSAAVSDRGLSDKRPQNEDSYLELPSKGIFVVADGVGGAQAGDVASQMAVEIVSEAFINLPETADAEEVMRVAIQRANEAIYQMASDLPQLSRMATTIVALHLEGNIATIGHVGDSRLYRLDPEGLLHQETEDHSVVAEEVRAGRMTPEQAAVHPSRNIISRALGAEPSVEVDMKTIMFEPNTSFLLCSDGITRHVEDHEIRSLLASGAPAAEIGQRLKAICYDRGAEDNLTAVVVFVSPQVAPAELPAESPQEEEIEEVTVSSARAAAASVVSEPTPVHQPAEKTEHPVVVYPEPEPEPVAPVVEPAEQAPASLIEAEEERTAELELPIQSAPSYKTPAPQTDGSIFASNTSYYRDEYAKDTSGSNTVSKIVSAVALVLVGVVFGFGSFYLWQRKNPPEPVQVPVLQSKSNDVPLTVFEEGRRLVDRDPAAYAMAHAATPQDAEDFYLLGRALLLSGKFSEARHQFDEAKNRLPNVEPSNAKTLAADVAIANAVLDSLQASESLSKNLSSVSTGQSNSNTANQARPIR